MHVGGMNENSFQDNIFFSFRVASTLLSLWNIFQSAPGVVDIVIEEGLLHAIHALHDIPDLPLHVMQDLVPAALLMIPLPQKEGSIQGNY